MSFVLLFQKLEEKVPKKVTLFENISKCRIFNEFFPTQNVNVARFARNVE